jgi:hypothetical protein
MNNNQQETKWSENVMLVDADYVDKVAFNLIVNFERMLGRRIPKADLAKWVDCVALDGGLKEGAHETLVVLAHQKPQLENFAPGDYAAELDGKAFKDHLGEFIISAIPIEAIADSEDYLTEALRLVTVQKGVKRVMVIPNAENPYIYNKVREVLNRVDDDEKRITVFAMEPKPGGNFRQEILGYSLMAALGIKGEEINSKSQ